jgi:hypothetical protein
MTPEQVNERLDITAERLSNKLDRLENKIETRFNAIDDKFANQRLLLIVAIVGSVIAQIINAWIVVLSHH